MRNTLKILALSLSILGTASIALADEAPSTGKGMQKPGSMMQEDGMKGGHDMKGGDAMKGGDGMSGMMGMMKMMQQMEPMMERCNEMMSGMTEHMKSAPHETKTPEDKG